MKLRMSDDGSCEEGSRELYRKTKIINEMMGFLGSSKTKVVIDYCPASLLFSFFRRTMTEYYLVVKIFLLLLKSKAPTSASYHMKKHCSIVFKHCSR